MPSCLTYFADHSTTENRGKTGGIVFLSFFLSAAILAVAFTQLNFTMSVLLLALWRILGLVAFIPLQMNPESNAEKKKRVSFGEVFQDKSLRLYIAAWTIFNLVDSFEWSIWGRNLAPSLSTVAVIGPILGSVAAFIGGVLSDRVGRKKVVICGFVILGLAYGALGIAPDFLFSWYFYLAVEGIAWGVLLVTFLFAIWGDLSQHGGTEKYYVIGAAPYFFKGIVDSIVTASAPESPKEYVAFSLASLLLFIAVLPLLFAPETMPEKKIEIRRLKGYVDQARKLSEKY
jgi:MFS family permease